ncbi:hypothetical protein GW17_00045979 [Ensete ventricosum]|nr:hypothetical protein GW17_00045979 [Ensete ventricosum]
MPFGALRSSSSSPFLSQSLYICIETPPTRPHPVFLLLFALSISISSFLSSLLSSASRAVEWKRRRRGDETKKRRGGMGTMEFFEELLLTALISVLLAFLIGKFAADTAVKPQAVPLARVSGPGLGLDPIEEEEEEETEKSEGKSSGCSGAGSGPPKTGVVEVVAERLLVERSERGDDVGGFDLNRENIADKLFSEVDLPRVEESSSKKEKVDNEVEIGRINYYSRRQQGGSVTGKEDGKKAVEKVVKLGREDAVDKEDAGEVGSLLHGEDEWEGIERSELEMLFGVASEFVGSKKGGDAVSKLSNEVQMQLYGLHKVAIEGPCHEPQPMALKVSARAKWYHRLLFL